MSNRKLYLEVEGIEFCETIIDDKEYDLTPSKIVPTVEIIKNAERALDGTMHVDITKSKRKLQIIFDILDNDTFEQVHDIFKAEKAEEMDPDGLTVKYRDLRGGDVTGRQFFVDNVSFVPHIVDDEVMWRDITIDLIEI